MTHYAAKYIAQAYGEGAYSAGCYSEGAVCGASTGNGGSNGLADTGTAAVIIVTLACILLFTAIVVRAWRRKVVPEEVRNEQDGLTDRSPDI